MSTEPFASFERSHEIASFASRTWLRLLLSNLFAVFALLWSVHCVALMPIRFNDGVASSVDGKQYV